MFAWISSAKPSLLLATLQLLILHQFHLQPFARSLQCDDSRFRLLTLGCLLAVILSCLLATAAFKFAAGLATSYGLLATLVLLPFVYVLLGLGLVSVTVTAKWALLPKFSQGQVVALWSSDFARWWFVCRLVNISNALFMRHFRGTVLLNWYYNLLVSTESLAPCLPGILQLV